LLVDALHEVGAARSIVIDENNVILAGNGLVEAAGEAGITKVKVVDADGETIIAVRRTNLGEAAKHRLALFDNRSSELSEWNPEELRVSETEGLFTAEELRVIHEPDFSPAGDPERTHGDVDGEDVAAAAERLRNLGQGATVTVAAMCPQCGCEFDVAGS
jgi:hypothetical protein